MAQVSLDLIKLTVMDFQSTISKEEEPRPQIQYEQCPHCQRQFFLGKLQLHLKLCSSIRPMLSSPRRTSPSTSPNQQSQQHCPNCKVKVSNFLYHFHMRKCPAVKQGNILEANDGEGLKTKPQVILKAKVQYKLPAIKKASGVVPGSVKQDKGRFKVTAREELSCFRLAQQIQKVECSACGRMFSKEASLRHIPICLKIHTQQHFDSIFKHKVSSLKGSLTPRIVRGDRQRQIKSCLSNQVSKIPSEVIQDPEDGN